MRGPCWARCRWKRTAARISRHRWARRSTSRRWTNGAWPSSPCAAGRMCIPANSSPARAATNARQGPGRSDAFPWPCCRGPSKITPDVEGSNPFNYVRLVQQVLDRQCVECHQRKARWTWPEWSKARTAGHARTRIWPQVRLLFPRHERGHSHRCAWRSADDPRPVRRSGVRAAALPVGAHYGVKLSDGGPATGSRSGWTATPSSTARTKTPPRSRSARLCSRRWIRQPGRRGAASCKPTAGRRRDQSTATDWIVQVDESMQSDQQIRSPMLVSVVLERGGRPWRTTEVVPDPAGRCRTSSRRSLHSPAVQFRGGRTPTSRWSTCRQSPARSASCCSADFVRMLIGHVRSLARIGLEIEQLQSDRGRAVLSRGCRRVPPG